MSRLANFFAGPYLDRRSDLRGSGNWRVGILDDSDVLFVVSRGSEQLVYSGVGRGIAFLRHDDPIVRAADERQLVLLGWFRDTRCVLIDLEPDHDFGPALPLPENARFEELRPIVGSLAEDEAALLAYVRALAIWRSRGRYCGACGSRTVPYQAGHVLRCSSDSCAQEFFPRLDPAIIVLVSDGERALLGRQSDWPPGRYSTIAGFVEPGESLEDAVLREVFEETGVRIRDTDYRSSQPWPFPSSLMLGFQATAASGSPIRLNGELEDARWFTPEQIATEVILPPKHSISHRLIREWLESR